MRQPRLIHLINGFDPGGAEFGVIHLFDYGFYDNVDLTVVALMRNTSVEARPYDHVLKALEQRTVKTRELCSESNMSVFTLLKSVIAMIVLLRKTQPEFLILSLPQSNLVGRFAAIFSPKTRVLSFEHNTVYSKRLYRPLLWATSLAVDSILADTEETLKSVMRRYYTKWKKQRGFVVPLVALPDQEMPRKQCYNLDNPIRMVSAGRLTATKNHVSIIDAICILQSRGIDVHLTLYGDGPEKDTLRKKAADKGITKRLTLAGFDRDWVTKACDADLFVIPSLHEGLCIVALEAMNCGLPVLAARTGGMLDYGQHNKNIWFLENTKPHGIADAVSTVAADLGLRSRLAQAGFQTAQELFSESSVRGNIRKVSSRVFGYQLTKDPI